MAPDAARAVHGLDSSARMAGSDLGRPHVPDFSPDNRPAPNGPSSFAPARDEGRGVGTEQSRQQPGVLRSPSITGSGGPGGDGSRPPSDPPAHSAPRPQAGGDAPGHQRVGPAVKGRIRIADEVVEKVAALAAMEVVGVADLGGDIARAVESVRERIGIGNKRGDQGIKADVSGQDVTISVTIMVEFGHVVMEVARQVQTNVAVQTHRMLGLNVAEVNVTVDDVRTTPPPEPGDAQEHAPFAG
jgi:uncharacterized alkaline shock family protein YloU